MALSPATSQKLGSWFSNYLQPKDAGDASNYFDDEGSAFDATPGASTTTNGTTSGLLSSSPSATTSDSTPAPAAAVPKDAAPTTDAVAKSAPATPPITNVAALPQAVTPGSSGAPLTADQSQNLLLYGNVNGPTATTPPPASTPAPAPAAAATPAATAAPSATAAPASTSTPAPNATTNAQAASGVTTDDSGVSTLNLDDLTQRTVGDQETVADQLNGLLASDSPYMQAARAGAQRDAAARGLLNSSIAAGSGEAAAIQSALPIAQADAATYSKVADYNASLLNQARMYNADAWNKMSLDEKDNAVQQQIAGAQAAASRANAIAAAAAQEYSATLSANASKYATDANAKNAADSLAFQTWQTTTNNAASLTRQQDQNNTSLVNNIMLDDNMPPERRAALLRSLGRGDLADAIYVVSSTSGDVTTDNSGTGTGNNGGG